MVGPAQYAMYATHQLRLPLPCAKHKRKAAPQHGVFRQMGKADCISLALARGPQNAVVAGQLALRAQPPLNPQQRGVQRKKHKCNLLQQVGPVVGAAQMLHLVQHNLTQLVFTQPLHQYWREKDAGMEKSKNAGTFNLLRNTKFGRTANLVACGTDVKQRLQLGINGYRSRAPCETM